MGGGGGFVHSEGGGGSYRNFRSGSKLLQGPGQINKQKKLQTAVGGVSEHPKNPPVSVHGKGVFKADLLVIHKHRMARGFSQDGEGVFPGWRGGFPRMARGFPQDGEGVFPGWRGGFPRMARGFSQDGEGVFPGWRGGFPRMARGFSQDGEGVFPGWRGGFPRNSKSVIIF